MNEIRHFTAWLVNDSTCLSGDVMDITVLEDMLIGGDPDDDGCWATDTSKKTPFYAETSVSVYDGEVAEAQDEARHLLESAGWRIEGQWQATPNAYTVPVERVAP